MASYWAKIRKDLRLLVIACFFLALPTAGDHAWFLTSWFSGPLGFLVLHRLTSYKLARLQAEILYTRAMNEGLRRNHLDLLMGRDDEDEEAE
jgi:hypothetical protein